MDNLLKSLSDRLIIEFNKQMGISVDPKKEDNANKEIKKEIATFVYNIILNKE